MKHKTNKPVLKELWDLLLDKKKGEEKSFRERLEKLSDENKSKRVAYAINAYIDPEKQHDPSNYSAYNDVFRHLTGKKKDEEFAMTKESLELIFRYAHERYPEEGELEQFFQQEFKPRDPKDVDSRLQLFKDTNWIMFHFDQTQDVNLLSTSLLAFKGSAHVTIKNRKTDRSIETSDYAGYAEVLDRSEGYIVFHCHTALRSKYLHMKAFFGHGSLPEIMLGTYSNIGNGGYLSVGTVIFKRAFTREVSDFTPTSYDLLKDNVATVPTEILRFLNEKHKNYVRVPSGILSLEDLQEFFSKQKSKILDRKWRQWQQKVTVFVSAPMTSIPKARYQEFREEVMQITQMIKEVLDEETEEESKINSELISGITSREQPESIKKANPALLSTRQNMERATHFLLVVPDYIEGNSSVFMEAMMAICRDMPIRVFANYDTWKAVAPYLAQGLEHTKDFRRYEYDEWQKCIRDYGKGVLVSIPKDEGII